MAPLTHAALHPTEGYYTVDPRPIPAPGAERADQVGELRDIDFYRWSYLVSPVVPTAELDKERGALPLLESLEEDALEAADTTREVISSDPEKKKAFEQELRTLLLREFSGSVPGPYQAAIWAWYEREVAYDRTHAAQVAALENGKRPWMARHLADKKFATDHAGVLGQKAQERQVRVANVKRWKSEAEAGVEWDRENRAALRELSAKRTQFVEAYSAKLLENASLASDTDWAAAEVTYNEALALLKATPAMRPEAYKKVLEAKERQRNTDLTEGTLCPAKNCPAEDFAIYIDVETALNQMMEMEADTTIDLVKKSTVGFDGYAVIHASLEAVFSAFMFRNGVPARAAELNQKKNSTFPVDDLFAYRREQSQVATEVWGPQSYFNRSLKQSPTGIGAGFVNPLSDSYLVIVRGNPRAGYDILFQFLGKACFPDEGQSPANCKTPTKSNFSILILRPLGENKTSFRISGRFMGQSYKFKDDLAAGSGLVLTGTSSIGFSRENFLKGQFDFNHTARRLDANFVRLKAGGAGATRIASSLTGHFFQDGTLVRLDPATPPSPRLLPIAPEQNFYLLGNEALQLIEDRGSRVFDRMAMQLYPVKNFR